MAENRLDLAWWHQRYVQQSTWTAAIRDHLFRKIKLSASDALLEVGSGTGAVLSQLADQRANRLFGVDLLLPPLRYAQEINKDFQLVQADGFHLPFSQDSFAVSYCHYLLLWVTDPAEILAEMRRVTRPGGCLIALAEPDHNARIDYPPPLDMLGKKQTHALGAQGADTAIGRKLRSLFHHAGLQEVETGILSAAWSGSPSQSMDPTEWDMIRADLADQFTAAQLSDLEEKDREACASGERVLFIPTFYAAGIVPQAQTPE